ncbi:MAG: hypothetical protein H7Y41_04610 [Hyphomonadaceae bacterium]|nr:hypothetical protein [Clostridia bacterium]
MPKKDKKNKKDKKDNGDNDTQSKTDDFIDEVESVNGQFVSTIHQWVPVAENRKNID